VRDAIVTLVPDISDCADVTAAHVAAITGEMDLNGKSIASLKAGDFSGLSSLTRLELLSNGLSGLPDDVFVDLSSVAILLLGDNELTSLSKAKFNGLSSLTLLDLHGNSLVSLPANVFEHVPSVRTVQLTNNRLASLPGDLFRVLTSLAHIHIAWNELTSLPDGIHRGLSLDSLLLNGNNLTSPSAGMFRGVSALGSLTLHDNPDLGSPPLRLTISLARDGANGVKATAPAGAPFDVVVPLVITGGSVPDDSITIPLGAVESAPFAVTRTPGPDGRTSVDIGNLSAPPTGHQGYELEKDPNLPLILTAETAPVLQAQDAEGVEDTVGSLQFEVGLDRSSGQVVTVDYETGDGTATASEDYTRTTGKLTFAVGVTTRTVGVAVLQDGTPEGDETLRLMLSNAVNATLATNSATGTILDDDPVSASLSISDADGLESGGSLEFPVTLGGDRGAIQTVSVDYATSDGTAESGNDYEAASGTLTFPADASSRTIRVSLLVDELEEEQETFNVVLTDPVGASLARSTATGTIRDRVDTPPSMTRTHTIPMFPSASTDRVEGLARIINRSGQAGEVTIHAFDDAGRRFGPLTLPLDAYATEHFTSDDLESGNRDIALTGRTGPGQGDWRLELTSELDIEALCYARDADGFLTTMNAVAPVEAGVHRVATLNPGYNTRQVGKLRVANPMEEDAEATVRGLDGAGNKGGMPKVDIPAGAARTFSSAELEPGSKDGTREALGSANSKWRLTVQSERDLLIMSVVSSPTGHLTNFSAGPSDGREDVHVVRLLPPASNALGRQGFVRVINRANKAVDVSVAASDATEWEYEPVVLTLGADAAAHFNTDDLEQGNASKGLSAGVGTGEGDWRLELTAPDIQILSFVRTQSGFVTAMDGLAVQAEDGSPRYYLPIFHPADHTGQESRLWLRNPGAQETAVTIRAVDDRGEGAPEGAVGLSVAGGRTRTLTSGELEGGTEGLTGRLGVGSGSWQLWVDADAPLEVMGLGHSGNGLYENLSVGRAGYRAMPLTSEHADLVIDSFTGSDD